MASILTASWLPDSPTLPCLGNDGTPVAGFILPAPGLGGKASQQLPCASVWQLPDARVAANL